MTSAVTILGLVAGNCSTLAYLPQVIKTWRSRSTNDISLGMFLMLVSGMFLWFVYGLVLGDLPLIIANGVTFLFALTILYFKLRQG